MDFAKKYKWEIGLFLFVTFIVCWCNNWLYYFFDILAKSSPAIAGLLAYHMWRQNREKEIKELEYRNDYYKKIIDKRIISYEKISEILVALSFESTNHRDESDRFHTCFENFEEFIKTAQKIQNISLYMSWFSNDIYDEIKSLFNVFLGTTGIPFNDDEKLKKYGIKNFGKINGISKNLTDLTKRDWIKLHQVEEFLNSKK